MNQTANIRDLRQKAKLPAKQAGGSTVHQFFEANKKALDAVLPKHVSPDRMLKIALGAMRTTPQLMECTTESLFGAVVQCAQLGLEPNTPMGHAYLIPFRNRRADRTDVQVIIGYRGLLDLARRSGQIVSIAAHAVHEHDKFDWEYGLDEKLSHRPADGARGEITHFYAVAKLVGGGHAFEVMPRADVDGVMRSTQSKGQYGPWKDHYEEMGRKTVIRRLFKYLPVSIELATASALDGKASAGEDQGLDAALTGEYTVLDDTAPPADGYDGPADEHPQPEQGGAGHQPQNDGTQPATSPAQETPDDIIAQMDRCEDPDQLAEIADYGASLFGGADKQRVTKAFNRRAGELTGATEAEDAPNLE